MNKVFTFLQFIFEIISYNISILVLCLKIQYEERISEELREKWKKRFLTYYYISVTSLIKIK